MGRYLDYMEIVNRCDEKLHEMVSGDIDDKGLKKLKEILEIQSMALNMSYALDRYDDAIKPTTKLMAMGDESAKRVMKEIEERAERNESRNAGRDFRDTSRHSESDRENSDRSWFPIQDWDRMSPADAIFNHPMGRLGFDMGLRMAQNAAPYAWDKPMHEQNRQNQPQNAQNQLQNAQNSQNNAQNNQNHAMIPGIKGA